MFFFTYPALQIPDIPILLLLPLYLCSSGGSLLSVLPFCDPSCDFGIIMYRKAAVFG